MTDLYNYVVTNYYTAEFLDHCFLPEVKDNEDDIFTTKSYYSPWVVKQEYNSENEFVKHYGNPLAMVKMSRRTIVVTKKDNKVSIKVFEYDRIRRAGKKFFKVQTNVSYITFNTLTNNLYTGSITNYHKKRKFTKRVRQNSFYEDPISKFSSIILNCTNQNFVVKNDVLKTFFDNIPLSKKYQRYDGIKRLHKLYLDHNKIKTPNNWDVFTLSYPQPKKIDYKKSKLKYIDTFMKLYELKGDKIKKALHSIETFQGVSFIKNLINVYGYDTIMSQDDNFIKNCLQYFSYGVSANIESLS
ncbi:MAG: hypothetical protein RLZ10_664, partial [Bacteroidota bacterium]